MTRDFEFVAGTVSLDLIDTVASRTSAPTDLLKGPAETRRWLTLAGFDIAVEVDRSQLKDLRALRETAYQLLTAAHAGEDLSAEAIKALNALAAKPGLRPQYLAGQLKMTSPRPFEAILTTIAEDVLRLLADDKSERLRRCPECNMLFFDQSRPGKRRWCSSSSGCGNRAKVRRHRERQKQGNSI